MFLCVHSSEPFAVAIIPGLCGDISGALLAPAALPQKPTRILRPLLLLECEQRLGAVCRGAQIQR